MKLNPAADDDDAKEKARFLAEAKAELADKKAHMKAVKEKKKAAQKRDSAAEKEKARRASITTKRQSIMTDTLPGFLLEIESDPTMAEDEDIVQELEDCKKLHKKVATLQMKEIESEDHELGQVKQFDDNVNKVKKAYRRRASVGLKVYTSKESEDIERQGQEIKNEIATLRKENQKFRDSIKSMTEDMQKLLIDNNQLEHDKKAMETAMEELAAFRDEQTKKGEYAEAMGAKYKQVLEEQAECVEKQSLMSEVEHNVKQVFERAVNNITTKFQNECDDETLVGKLGSITGEEDD